MHETPPNGRLASVIASLVGHEGWPLVAKWLADSEWEQLQQIRQNPTGPEAGAAAVKLAHIEELRTMFRCVTPSQIGDPFDVSHRPCPTWDPPEFELDPGLEPDEYDEV